MGYKLVIKTLAEQDITEALEWYSIHATHLTTQFVEKIEDALKVLQRHPEHYQRRYMRLEFCLSRTSLMGFIIP